MEVGEPRKDGHEYWKMRISSIHRGEESVIWIVGRWFYSPSNLNDDGSLGLRKRYGFYFFDFMVNSFLYYLFCRELALIERMGNAELTESNHMGVVDAACIEGKLQAYIL